MGKGLILTLTLFAAALEPVASVEPDPFKFAITQGGLFGIVLVLLVYIRMLHNERLAEQKQRADEKLAEKDVRIADKDERLQAMITLATEVKTALVRSMDAATAQATAAAAQAASLQSMAMALAKIEERKNPR